jgi:hypothetical protein
MLLRNGSDAEQSGSIARAVSESRGWLLPPARHGRNRGGNSGFPVTERMHELFCILSTF